MKLIIDHGRLFGMGNMVSEVHMQGDDSLCVLIFRDCPVYCTGVTKLKFWVDTNSSLLSTLELPCRASWLRVPAIEFLLD